MKESGQLDRLFVKWFETDSEWRVNALGVERHWVWTQWAACPSGSIFFTQQITPSLHTPKCVCGWEGVHNDN